MTVVSGVSNDVLAVAFVATGLGFLRRYRRGEAGLPTAVAARHVGAALLFCVLLHAADAMEFYRPSRPLFAAASMLAAVVAPAVVWGRPRAALGSVAAGPSDRSRAWDERQTYVRLNARVTVLEDGLRRSLWLRDSRLAMDQLGGMLSGCEAAAGVGAEPRGAADLTSAGGANS